MSVSGHSAGQKPSLYPSGGGLGVVGYIFLLLTGIRFSNIGVYGFD
jgi:hypothetical protein